ncbi:hypothetical protein DENSPDRAFT_501799 [Dentipellis sp. KUC8613]|nr:hypothetical protein DENSPDRAFT_501799 [Dentipellis sp. KUC8613]
MSPRLILGYEALFYTIKDRPAIQSGGCCKNDRRACEECSRFSPLSVPGVCSYRMAHGQVRAPRPSVTAASLHLATRFRRTGAAARQARRDSANIKALVTSDVDDSTGVSRALDAVLSSQACRHKKISILRIATPDRRACMPGPATATASEASGPLSLWRAFFRATRRSSLSRSMETTSHHLPPFTKTVSWIFLASFKVMLAFDATQNRRSAGAQCSRPVTPTCDDVGSELSASYAVSMSRTGIAPSSVSTLDRHRYGSRLTRSRVADADRHNAHD